MSICSSDCWPCRYYCCLLAGCTLGYRCRSLWTHMLYQSHFVDHFQEHQGQDHSWQLQGGHSYSVIVATMQAQAINSGQTKRHAECSQTASIEMWKHTNALTLTAKWIWSCCDHFYSRLSLMMFGANWNLFRRKAARYNVLEDLDTDENKQNLTW